MKASTHALNPVHAHTLSVSMHTLIHTYIYTYLATNIMIAYQFQCVNELESKMIYPCNCVHAKCVCACEVCVHAKVCAC